MGGDQGPHIIISAAVLAINTLPNLHLILCGDSSIISQELSKHQLEQHPRLAIVHTTEIVEMGEKPAVALRTKKNSSMRVAINLVQQGKAQACVSAGNTGALFSIAHFVLKTLPGVERPALISSLPTHDDNKHVFMLDLGANISCNANMLYQFGVMGSVLAQEGYGLTSPKVALLNLGEEDNKGSEVVKAAADMLQTNSEINYTGFVEGNDIFNNKADVIVCDGFVGNVALKTCEGVARLLHDKLQLIAKRNIMTKIVGKLLTSTIKKLFKSLNPDQYNGASLIGLRGIVVKSHGNAGVKAFFAAIQEAIKETERQVPDKIIEKLGRELLQRP